MTKEQHGALTGRTRYRAYTVRGVFSTTVLLVLQVECHNQDWEFSSCDTFWRDAAVEDLGDKAMLKARNA